MPGMQMPRGAAIGSYLLRIVQLFGRHRLAFAYFGDDVSGTTYFFAYWRSCPVAQSLYVYRRETAQEQRPCEADRGQ